MYNDIKSFQQLNIDSVGGAQIHNYAFTVRCLALCTLFNGMHIASHNGLRALAIEHPETMEIDRKTTQTKDCGWKMVRKCTTRMTKQFHQCAYTIYTVFFSFQKLESLAMLHEIQSYILASAISLCQLQRRCPLNILSKLETINQPWIIKVVETIAISCRVILIQ